MKELSVAVLGGGRWARALMGLLVQNQRKARGTIKLSPGWKQLKHDRR